MAIAADHPLAQAAAAKNPKLAEFIADVKKIGTAQEIIDTAEKQGFDTGIKAVHPFDPTWKLPVYCRELRADGIRHRRDLRLPGARPARPRLRQQIQARQYPGGLPRGPGPEDVCHHRHRL
jgi:leucyl-tRNA synthetase